MNASERNKLSTLADRWRREASALSDEASRNFDRAGTSHEEGGTGDEGWKEMIEQFAQSDVLHQCAVDLFKLIQRLEGRP